MISTRKKKKILYILIFIFLLFLLLIIAWNKLQYSMFFHPWHDSESYEKLQGINEFKEIKIKNKRVSLSGWFWNIQGNEKAAPLVIFFTGNLQNSSNVLYHYYNSEYMKDVFGEYNLLVVDYPKYGLSKGKLSDKSMFEASNYIFEYASQMSEVDPNNIVIVGYSIGTGVATYCASQNNASGLILIAPYDNALNLYNDTLDIFHGALEKLPKYHFDSISYAKNVIEPTTIITSKADDVIKYTHSLNLSTYFSNINDVIVLEDTNHGGYFSQETVLDTISNILK